jgi:hypothetical protein
MGIGWCCCWYDAEAAVGADTAKKDNSNFAVTLPAELHLGEVCRCRAMLGEVVGKSRQKREEQGESLGKAVTKCVVFLHMRVKAITTVAHRDQVDQMTD